MRWCGARSDLSPAAALASVGLLPSHLPRARTTLLSNQLFASLHRTGHMGIADSQGKIHDFQGPYNVGVDDFMVCYHASTSGERDQVGEIDAEISIRGCIPQVGCVLRYWVVSDSADRGWDEVRSSSLPEKRSLSPQIRPLWYTYGASPAHGRQSLGRMRCTRRKSMTSAVRIAIIIQHWH